MGAFKNTIGAAITVALVIGGNSVTAAVAQTGPSVTAAPAAVTATTTTFGADGSHYPTDTPDLRAITPTMHVVNVAASSTAIRTALNALTAAQIDAGAVILVAPGNIPNMTALNGYSNTRAKKVLITARDGFETVAGTSGWVFSNVRGISVMRFTLATLDVKGATHCSFGWIKLTNNYFGTAPVGGVPVSNVEFVEMVEPESVVKSSDSSQVKAYSPESMTGVSIIGSYIAPSYFKDGTYNASTNPKPHTDALQIEGGAIAAPGVTISDTAVFAGNNAAVIIGGVPNIGFNHVLIVGGGVQTKRYPYKPGGAGYAGATQPAGTLSAIQGTGGGNVNALDSTFIGALVPTWSKVTNTRTNQTGKKSSSGSFTYDTSLTSWTASNIDAATPYPTAQLLASIWNVRGTTASKPAAATSTPSATASTAPTAQPTVKPTAAPSAAPSAKATVTPSVTPSARPTVKPTATATATATVTPTAAPTPSATLSPWERAYRAWRDYTN